MKSALQEQVESRHGHCDKIDWKWKCAAQIYIVLCAGTLAWNGPLRLSRPLLITTTIRYDVSLMWSLTIWIIGTWQPSSLLVMNGHQKDVYYDKIQQFVENIDSLV